MLKCPKCSSLIPDSDFNVSTDIAYCRRCRINHSYKALLEDSELESVDLEEPPKHVYVRNDWNGYRIRYRKVSPALLFFIPFTAVWSGGSMFAMYSSMMKSGLSFETLFFTPFFIGTCVLVCAIIFMLLGYTQATIRDNNVELFTGVAGIGRKRVINTEDIKSVAVSEAKYRSNDRTATEVQIKLGNGRTVKFGAFISDEAKSFFAGYLKKQVKYK